MKRKYYFVILFLVLAIFFILNTSSVNAKMYKILDSEGNVICITNNPVLSIKEKEAGYTISPPPEESIIPTQEQITNGQENKQKSLSKGNKYDFLNTHWGMSKEEVKKMEKAGLIEGNREGEDHLEYQGKVDGLDCHMTYSFREDKLTSTGCAISQPVFDTSSHNIFGCYFNIQKYFIKKYGEIFKETALGELKNFNSSSWDTSLTKVDMFIEVIDKDTVLLIECKSKAEPELNSEK
jgi:hypothetical protein